MIKKTVLSLAAIILVLLVTTYIALEQSDVLIVETFDGSLQQPRYTHIWFVENKGTIYLEAGHPQNPWIVDLANGHTLGIQGANLDGWYAFNLDISDEGHQQIRTLMRAKYGWRDWWIGLLFDTSQSQLITLAFTDQIT